MPYFLLLFFLWFLFLNRVVSIHHCSQVFKWVYLFKLLLSCVHICWMDCFFWYNIDIWFYCYLLLVQHLMPLVWVCRKCQLKFVLFFQLLQCCLHKHKSVLTFTRRDLNSYSQPLRTTIFARHLNFSTWFTKNFIIPGTKKDLIMD